MTNICVDYHTLWCYESLIAQSPGPSPARDRDSDRPSIKLLAPRVINLFQEAETLVVLPFIMPPKEKTMGWKGESLLAR
jgi:hypothetical protein